MPNWIVNKGGKSKKDMLYAVFTTQEDFNWHDELEPYDHTVMKRPKFLIKKDEEIKRTFKHTITEPEDLEVHAQAFFLYFAGENDDNVYDGKNRICYGQKTNNEPIKVQIKEQ